MNRIAAIIIVLGFMTLCFSGIASATPVPDTGQTKCYNNTVEIPCPQPGQPFYGQDAQYGPNLHSYTDLENGVVRDNVTGLEWQQATAPGGGSVGYPNEYTWEQAIDYCNNLSLGSKDDWRLPTVKELSTLVDSSIPNPGPTINMSYFPDTVASDYWSSTTYASNTNNAWTMGFMFGGNGQYGKSNYHYVRAVRGGQLQDNNFIDNGDGTVTDTSTGLMWQQEIAPGTYTWEQAITYCENLTLAGYSDWRLPNRNELQSIVDYSRFTPSIDTTYFPGTVASEYWSSTTNAGHTDTVLSGNFDIGATYQRSTKTYGYYYVRAVRGGQVDNSTTTTVSNTTTSILGGTTTTIPGGTTTISVTTTVSGSTTSIVFTSTTTSAAISSTIPSTSTTTIIEPELKADFVRDKASGPPPLVVQFTDMSSGNITSYSWDFGDKGTSTERNPTHTYLSEGTFTVSLRVEGNGKVDDEVKLGYITVKYNPPTTTTVPGGGGCPAKTVMGEGSQDIKTLHAFRNEMFTKTAVGKYYTTIYYKNAFELNYIFKNKKELKEKANNLVQKIMPTIEGFLIKREVVISEDTIQEVIELIDALKVLASPILEKDLTRLKQDIQNGVIFSTFKMRVQQ